MKKHQVYLDYAAATPVDKSVAEAMQPYLAEYFYNPSAIYLAAKRVAKDIDQARSAVAALLGAKTGEIIFTSGGTEANNLAISGVMAKFANSNVVVSAIEHESVLAPAAQYHCRSAPVLSSGIIDVARLQELIDDNTALVSVMYANNEIGTIQPIREISAKIAQIRKEREHNGNKLPLYFHTDACQAANYLDLHVSNLGIDMMTLNGGKIYGPKQSGALYLKNSVRPKPLILGGGQERGRRSGTENVAGIIGFAAALAMVQNRRKSESERLLKLQSQFIKETQAAIPDLRVNGSIKHRLPNNVNFSFPDQDNERLLMRLDEMGVMCASGSACSASDEEPSHVLKAIGLNESVIAGSLRFTMGAFTDESDIAYAANALKAGCGQ